MKNNTFFLIPDISGFTKFVSKTETNHGQHIIRELLEILIDSNQLDLTVGEIEGDAVMFYKEQHIPSKQELLKQARSMFINFHQHLKTYESHRICECGACRGAGNLSLKIVAHAGESDFINVKGQQKPYGQDIILVHRLLKNDIESNEYLLLSDRYMDFDTSEIKTMDFPWVDLKHGSSEYDSLGVIGYSFTILSDLHGQVPEPQIASSLKTVRPIIVETNIERKKEDVFEIIIDLEKRMSWNRFANKIEYDQQINQVGTKHVCVFDAKNIEFTSVKANFGENSLVYGEKLLDPPSFAKEITIYFIVSDLDQGCQVQMQIHYELKPVIGWVLGPIFRRKNIQINTQVLQHLKEYCESTQLDALSA